MPFVPRHTFSLLADYELRLNGDLRAGVTRLSSYSGSSRADFGPARPVQDPASGLPTAGTAPNHQYLPLDSYWLTDLSLRLEGDKWTARLFADNLFDARFTTSRQYYNAHTNFSGPDASYNANRPRTVGLEVIRRF